MSDTPQPESELSTTQLFRRYAEAHDPDALQALVRRIEPMLFAKASRRIADHLQARFGPEDITQSVLVVFVRKMEAGQIEWQGSLPLRALLCKMICQKVKEYVRRHSAEKRSTTKEVSLQAAPTPSLEPQATDEEIESFAQEELHQRIKELIEHFKDKPMHLKVLPRIIAGEEKVRIAEDLGITKRRVDQIMGDAERFVRKRLLDPN